MRIYLASSLTNINNVRQLRDVLTQHGHVITYDWTLHGQVRGSQEQLRAIALNEMTGVYDAQIVIALLPGRRGTHTEIGAAIAYHKPIILCADDLSLFDTDSPETTMAYHHPSIWSKLVKPNHAEILEKISKLEESLWTKSGAHFEVG